MIHKAKVSVFSAKKDFFIMNETSDSPANEKFITHHS